MKYSLLICVVGYIIRCKVNLIVGMILVKNENWQLVLGNYSLVNWSMGNTLWGFKLFAQLWKNIIQYVYACVHTTNMIMIFYLVWPFDIYIYTWYIDSLNTMIHFSYSSSFNGESFGYYFRRFCLVFIDPYEQLAKWIE